MAFIGNTVQNQGFTPAIDYFNGNGVTVTFTLSRPIASVAQVIVAIDNVIQNPSSSFTVAGNAITFSSAPLSGTNNIWVEYTSLITTYQGISQDPTVIGDIRATGGYLTEGDFGNSFVSGAILDYVTGLGRVTVGPAEGIALYNGGTSGRVPLATFTSTGQLLVNTTTALAQTTIYKAGSGLQVSSPQLTLQNAVVDGGTGDGPGINFANATGAVSNIGSAGNGVMFFSNRANTGAGWSERMRIDSSGNVGIGGTPSFKFDVRNNGAVSQVTAYFANEGTNSAVNNLYSVIPSQSFNTNSSHFAGQTAGTNTWLLYGNGTTSYSSDANLKKNIVTTRDGYIDDVAKLRVVKYQWKANSDDSAVELGLIAQEVAEVFPGLVKDETAINSDGTKGATSKVILGSVFQPILIKCVQELNTMIKEQQAMIEELKIKVAALEAR